MKSAAVAILFRRKCGTRPPRHFVACLVADACEDAIESIDKAKLKQVEHLAVAYGPEQRTEDAQLLGIKPSYYWVRVDTNVIGENPKIPKHLRRKPNGLLKPKYI